jgi:hypothetical protein
MTFKTLLAAVTLTVCAPFAAAAPPQLTLRAPGYEITTAPGGTIAYVYFLSTDRHAAGTLTDSDNDGKVLLDLGATRETSGRILVADVTTGEFTNTERRTVPLGLSSILPGPTGRHTELVIERQQAAALWVRPGVGAWAPPAGLVEDTDGSPANTLVVGSIDNFEPAGSSPARPDGFRHGDLFFHLEPTSTPFGGLVDAVLDRPNYPGAMSFVDRRRDTPTTEGEDVVYTIFRLFGTEGTVSVRCCAFNELGGRAAPGVDYLPVDTLVTFGPGELVKRVHVRTIDDEVWAGYRGLEARLYDPAGTVLFGATLHDAGIADDDPVPVLVVEGLPASITETDAEQAVTAILTIAAARRIPVTVRVTRNTGSDAELVFQPGETRKEFVIPIAGDDVPKSNYTLRYTFTLRETQQQSIIRELLVVEDDLPTVTIDDAAGEEGGRAALKITYDPFKPSDATFRWRTVDGTAKAGLDYVASSGTTSLPSDIVLLEDSEIEGHETFYLEILEASRVTVVRMRIEITIFDDDGLPLPSFSNLRTVEGNGNGRLAAPAKLSLPAPLAFPVTYQVTSTPGTATPGVDYVAATITLTFQAGQTELAVPVSIVQDEYREEDETFTLAVTGTNVTAVYTIVDDDTSDTPLLTPHDISIIEGDVSAVVRVRVTMSAPATHPVTVRFEPRDGTANPLDYERRIGTLTFEPGVVEREIPIRIFSDRNAEPDEWFVMEFLNVAGAVLTHSEARVTIIDDDTPEPGRNRAVRH